MINSKDQLKELGDALRSSNSTHQARLRAQLADLTPVRCLPFDKGRLRGVGLQWLTLTASAFAILVITIVTWPDPEPVTTYQSAPEPGLSVRDLSDESVAGGSATVDGDYTLTDEILLGHSSFDNFPSPKSEIDSRDIVDYAKDHGAMLAKTTTVALMTKEADAVGKIESLFTSFGGHLSSISDYGLGQPPILTGTVPTDSYFMFREQLHDLVKADKYIFENLNANDLIPSAIAIDDTITDVTKSIANLKVSIEKTTDANKKAYLQRQLTNLETQLADLNDSRSSLTDRAKFVNVAVTVDVMPSFWSVHETYDLKRLVAGYASPGLLEQVWINVLVVCFGAIQIMSVAFWFLIPLIFWLIYRRRQRQAWKELD